ncbi:MULTISPECIES: NnrU family protein [Marinomonas]|uniref:NnrU family protein n=1 Tax=Marinomonas rhodophyticola TaxID=2992803 RepID=A0ABT3KAW6_9GAMM|nr:NnrU family protein [Marinomonas sp. KJ51-3]MCW4627634.1 NnrU family protein [Marinomonas sp. KJ51-3]
MAYTFWDDYFISHRFYYYGLYANANGTGLVMVSPVWTRHLAGLLMLVALFFVGSALVPNTTMKKKVGYPMLIAVKIWAFSHLISNGNLADIIVFGSFLIWSIVSFAIYRRRDRKAGVVRDQESGVQFDLAAFTFAMVSWFIMVFYLHEAIIGVSPLV